MATIHSTAFVWASMAAKTVFKAVFKLSKMKFIVAFMLHRHSTKSTGT